MDDEWILWQNNEFVVITPKNPHIGPEEGCHIIILTKKKMGKSWDNPELAGKTFELATKISKIIIEEKIADWANIQNNQNWGLLPGGKLNFHIHIYGRKKSGKTWTQSITLPKLPNTFKNEPLPEKEREILRKRLKESFG
jgi:diadenosine tetraphosphate (Ap4A) HIT family hydrolase